MKPGMQQKTGYDREDMAEVGRNKRLGVKEEKKDKRGKIHVFDIPRTAVRWGEKHTSWQNRIM